MSEIDIYYIKVFNTHAWSLTHRCSKKSWKGVYHYEFIDPRDNWCCNIKAKDPETAIDVATDDLRKKMAKVSELLPEGCPCGKFTGEFKDNWYNSILFEVSRIMPIVAS